MGYRPIRHRRKAPACAAQPSRPPIYTFDIYSLYFLIIRDYNKKEKNISERYIHIAQMHATINKKEVTARNRIKINIRGVPFKMSDLVYAGNITN